jgi:segregation and condensation protein B
VARDYDPVQGQWYEDLEENEIFRVLSVDPDEEIIEVQYENGDIEEIDLEHAPEPEGWASDDDDEDEEEEDDEDEDDWDEDEDDDDWDDDDDEDLDDDDYSDRDDA